MTSLFSMQTPTLLLPTLRRVWCWGLIHLKGRAEDALWQPHPEMIYVRVCQETFSVQMWALRLFQSILNINASGGYLPLHLSGNSFERVLMGLLVAALINLQILLPSENSCISTFWVREGIAVFLNYSVPTGQRRIQVTLASSDWLMLIEWLTPPMSAVCSSARGVLHRLCWTLCLGNAEKSVILFAQYIS